MPLPRCTGGARGTKDKGRSWGVRSGRLRLSQLPLTLWDPGLRERPDLRGPKEGPAWK